MSIWANILWIDFSNIVPKNQQHLISHDFLSYWGVRKSSACGQYLNCKILHGGTILQPWRNAFGMRKYFSEDYVIPSPKLNEHRKKRSSPEIEVVFRQN